MSRQLKIKATVTKAKPEIRIFARDGVDWFAAASLEDAIRAAVDYYEDDLSAFNWSELNPLAMDGLKYIDDAGDPDRDGECTFRERLNRMIDQDPDQFPCFFATSEF